MLVCFTTLLNLVQKVPVSLRSRDFACAKNCDAVLLLNLVQKEPKIHCTKVAIFCEWRKKGCAKDCAIRHHKKYSKIHFSTNLANFANLNRKLYKGYPTSFSKTSLCVLPNWQLPDGGFSLFYHTCLTLQDPIWPKCSRMWGFFVFSQICRNSTIEPHWGKNK